MSLDPDSVPRLDKISTQQSLAFRAFCDRSRPQEDIQQARQILLLRYARAIRRYVGGWLRNDEEADETAQEIYVRVLAGECEPWRPTEERFRDFLLREVKRIGWQRIKAAQREQPLPPGDVSAREDNWQLDCRQAILDQAWQALKELEGTNRYYSVLRLQADQPESSGEELAQRLNLSPGNFRVTLHRARERYAEFVRDAVANTIAEPTPDKVKQEFRDLQLMVHVKGFLQADWTD